jgi:hypothetical protein
MTNLQVNHETIARSYLDVWNDPDQSTRLLKLRAGWSNTVRYADPLMSGETPSGISSMIEAARGQFPGHSFVLRGKPDGHGSIVRFSWDLVSEERGKVGGGTDIVRLDSDGKFFEVIGFLD